MKKLITLLILFVGMVSSASADTKTVYIKLHSNWEKLSPYFKLYTYGASEGAKWHNFTHLRSNIYVASYDESPTGLIVVRRGDNVDTFDDKWNQSGDITSDLPTTAVCYDFSDGSDFNPKTTTFPSAYTDKNFWVGAEHDIAYNYIGWNETGNIPMTNNNDFTYTLSLTGNLVGVGTYGYKIVNGNGNWLGNPDDGNNNYAVEITAAGKYNITYTYNVITEKASVETSYVNGETATYKYFVNCKDAEDAVAIITGGSWDNDGNLMTVTNNIAQKSYSGQNLTVQTYTFNTIKCAYNSSDEKLYEQWTGDQSLSISIAGTYAVTFSYNTVSKGNPWVLALRTASAYYYIGGNGSWDSSKNNPMVDTESNGIFSIVLDNKANHSFAIAPDYSYGEQTTVQYWDDVIRPASNTTLQFENNSGMITTGGSNYWSVKNDYSDYIKLSFNSNTNTWSVKPYFTRNISADYATFSSAYDVAVDGAVAWYAKEVQEVSAGNNRIVMKKFTNGIPANTGALLEGSGDVTFTPAASTPTAPGTNLLVATVDETPIAVSTTGAYHYILGNGGAGVGFYNVNEARNSAAGKAYLATTKQLATENANARAAWIFDEEGETTGIAAVKASQKMNGEFFNLAGQRVAQPTKGLYIVNGKKVIIK